MSDVDSSNANVSSASGHSELSRIPVLVLGAGPSGLGMAWRLARRKRFHVTVIERNAEVGGNAGSFSWGGQQVDFGSHRLHPSCAPEILGDIQRFLGNGLLDRPRHGRIHLRGRWLHFPLKPQEAITRLPPGFLAGIACDAVTKIWRASKAETFADVLQHGLGHTICRDFYFPYAKKIWGREPHELDAEQARRRVSAGSLVKLTRKVLSALPGVQTRRSGKGRFFYPRAGFGAISEAYRHEAESLGANVVLATSLQQLRPLADGGWAVHTRSGSRDQVWNVHHVFSTIPLTQLVHAIDPPAPESVLASTKRLTFRAMILIYLQLDAPYFTEFDAHYFPDARLRITRLSEPKHYALSNGNTTVLCAELPCDVNDAIWQSDEDSLLRIVKEDLATAGIPLRAGVRQVAIRRLPQAYPIYTRDFQSHFHAIDQYVSSLSGVTSLGRQGLFAHDNTHHTLAMAYAADECFSDDGKWNAARWSSYRSDFEHHIVED